MIKRLALAAFLTASLHAAGQRPNIIFVLTDDMGWGDFGVFFQNIRKENGDRSQPWHMTPALDRMAADGLQMPHHYCPAPVCAPSRASLLLGVHQGHSEIRDNQFDKALPDNHTLATVMRGAGYSTAAIGKWGLQGKGGSPKEWLGYPTKHGFDFFHGYVRHRDGHFHYPKEDGREIWENEDEISGSLAGCYTADLFTARAKKWIIDQQRADIEKPFFLYLAYDTPHAKTQLPAAPYPAGGGLNGGIQWLGEKGNMITTARGRPDSYFEPDYANATWDHDKNPDTAEVAWPDVYKRYATSIRRIDECMADLFQTLKDLGIDDNTLVVFTTDNGPSRESYLDERLEANFFNSFGPFDGIKRDVIEGGIRVGALVRWPDQTSPGQVSSLPSQFHDWMPTFAELAGIGTPARADGTSLVPTITGQGKQKAPQVYIEYSEGGSTPDYPEFAKSHRGKKRAQMQAIRYEDFIGVRYQIKTAGDPFKIYDINKDPQQTKNLASEMPDLEEKMRVGVLQMRRPEKSAQRPYDSAPVPSVVAETLPGIEWTAYRNTAPWLARIENTETILKGISGTIETPANSEANTFLFQGFIEIPADGTYTFHLPEGATALLRLHEATVIDSAYAPAEKSISAEIVLQKGQHPIRMYWKKSQSSPALKISSPGIELQEIPPEMLSH